MQTHVASSAPSAAHRPTASGPDPRPTRHGHRFEPGLEGLRGVAVVAVLFFHAGFPWASGGFLGVSTFFTLSGYLITSLLVAEHAEHGRIDLRRFWGRRFRRLMPASLLCLAGIVLFGALVADASQLATLRGDVLAALAYVANWHFVLDGQGYTDLFSSPSPVLHFWSLAIEEQFYVVFPLLVAVLLRIGRGSRKVLAGALVLLVAGSVAASLVLFDGTDPSRVYYGTDTRAAELLLGAVLALAMAAPRGRAWLGSPGARRGAAGLGVVAFAVVIWTFTAVSEGDDWLYRGGLAAFAGLSALVVVGAIVPGPLRSALSARPLRWLGAISYGVYLIHWPVFLWLTPDRVGLTAWPLFGVRMAVTLALAVLSYRLLEQPVRSARRLTGHRPWLVAPACVALVAVGAVAVTARPPADAQADYEVAIGLLAAPGPAPEPAPVPPTKVMVYGDSVALSLLPGLKERAATHGDLIVVNTAWAGCGTGNGGKVKVLQFVDLDIDPYCAARPETTPPLLTEHQPDDVLVLTCLYDIAARALPGEGRYRVIGDPVYDRWLADAMHETVAMLSATGARVSWFTCPPLDPADLDHRAKGQPERRFEERDPARIERLNELIREVAASEPAMRVVEFGAYLEGLPGGSFDPSLRDDGVHLHEAGSRSVTPWVTERLREPRASASPVDGGAPVEAAVPVEGAVPVASVDAAASGPSRP